jgi:hypothetical protein
MMHRRRIVVTSMGCEASAGPGIRTVGDLHYRAARTVRDGRRIHVRDGDDEGIHVRKGCNRSIRDVWNP